MTTVTKQLRTETGHRLTNYEGRCAHLHGHSYLWEVTCKRQGGLDDKNMVMDFKDLKKAMNLVLDPLDHALVLSPTDPLWNLAAHAVDFQFPLHTVLQATNGESPRLIAWHDNPTAESFAQWALLSIQRALEDLFVAENPTEAMHRMPYFISAVRVWETATSFAEANAVGAL